MRIVSTYALGLMLWSVLAIAQTTIDLRTQSKSVDFSQASATKPYKTGTSLPATCEVGEAFFDLSEVAGSNLHLCTATDTWSKVSGGGIAGPAGSAQFGVAVFSDTTGSVLAEGTGCTITTVGGKGVLTCDGGLEAGDGSYQGGLITKETEANGGTFEWAIFGPADQAGDRCIVFPDQQPAAGQVLAADATLTDVVLLGKTFTGCRVMQWTTASGGGPVTDDTVLVGNGTSSAATTIPACAGSNSKLLYAQTTNTFSCATDQIGSGSSIDCLDPANSCVWDDFYAGATGTSTIGALGWRETGSTFAYQAGEDGAPGIAQIGTTTALDNTSALVLNAGSSNEPMLAMDTKTFTLQMRFRTSRTTEIGAHVGIKDDVTFGVNGDGFFLSFDTAVPETNYQYVVCNGTCYTADSGAALSPAWRRVKISNDGGSVATFSLYDETGTLIAGSTKTFCAAASGCDVNSVVFPTGATMLHTFTVVNRGSTTAATLDADYFSFQMTGLSR